MSKQSISLITVLMMACCVSISWAAEPVKAPTPKPTNTKPPTTVAYSESYYAKKIEATYGGLAGSSNNLQSLTQGLRNSTPVTLTTVGPTGEVSIATFDPPTKPMGYGNISRALDFASKELAVAGISNPTAEQLQAALMGGSVINHQGQLMNMQGVLQLRSDGMGWGQIAHHLNISPAASANSQHTTFANGAHATRVTELASDPADRVRDVNGNAYGAQRSGIVNANGNGGGSIQTAAGSSGPLAKGQLDKATGNERSSIVSAAGAGSGPSTNGYALGHTKGIVNAGGASAGYGGIMHGDGSGFGGGAYAASAGASAMVGAGNGNGNAFGHAKGKD